MPITLDSRVRRMQVFNLPHESFCRERCACSQTTVVVTAENPRTGERARKHVPKTVPGSMTLLAGERREGLPTALLEAPDVKTAIAHGHVRLVAQTPDPASTPSTPSTPSAPSAPSAPGPKGA